jgi:PAS domain S-box-containing protein
VLGYSRDELLGKPLTGFIPAGQAVLHRDMLTKKLEGAESTRYEMDIFAKDGRKLTLEVDSRLVRDAKGSPTAIHSISRDITDRKYAEKRQRVLMDELNHRVKNTLTIVQSLAHQTIRGSNHGGEFTGFEDRLFALARAHDLLMQTSWDGASIASIIQSATRAFSAQRDRSQRINASGEDIIVPSNVALSLAMTLHELGTNALKYGALSRPDGTVRVTWKRVPELGLIELFWAEEGGPAVEQPTRRGFGSRLIEKEVRHGLGGDLNWVFLNGSLLCRLRFPIPSTDILPTPPREGPL